MQQMIDTAFRHLSPVEGQRCTDIQLLLRSNLLICSFAQNKTLLICNSTSFDPFGPLRKSLYPHLCRSLHALARGSTNQRDYGALAPDFISAWVSSFGVLTALTPDRVRQFESAPFPKLSNLAITHFQTAAYHTAAS